MNNNYGKITALYSHLSVDDEDRDGGESNSIQNQKKFLESYARQLKLTNIRHYIDDDESGRFFDRSAYSRMIEDVENGKISVCIMKDMTRWGRDYLQVGNAMEIFRRNNVRFIAVNNGIDSEKPDTLEFAPFINIMSEWYAKTTDIWFDEKDPLIHIRTHNTDLKKRLATYAGQHPDQCRQTDTDPETGCMEFEIRKGRFSFRLTAPYSEERRRAASKAAKKQYGNLTHPIQKDVV